MISLHYSSRHYRDQVVIAPRRKSLRKTCGAQVDLAR